MHATKKQIAVITVLNIIIAALVGILLYFGRPVFSVGGEGDGGGDKSDIAPSDDGEGGGGDADVVAPPAHNKLREAKRGKVNEIVYQQQLMGTGDESVIFCTSFGGVTYIIGNAVVGDYDFDSSGGFLCRLDDDGKIVGFSYFDGKVTAAAAVEGGFAAATIQNAGTDEQKSYLYTVDGDGLITLHSELDGIAVDVMPVGSKKLAVVTKISGGTIKLVEYTRAGTGWAVGNSTRISSGLNIDYFDCYMINDEYVIAARAYSTGYDAMAFYSFAAGGDGVPHYYGGNDESMLRPYAVMPYKDGFMAVCDKNGEAAIATLDYKFSIYRRDMLGFKCGGASLTYGGGKYYACFNTDDGIVTYEVDDELNKKPFNSLHGAAVTAVVSMDSSLFVCYKQNSLLITDCAEVSATLDITDAKVCRAIKTGYNRLLIVLSATGGKALSASTGGADVYIISVKL